MSKTIELPRYWKKTIRQLTGLYFCDRECPCGAHSNLWWYPPGGSSRDVPKWVPSWMNGADSYEIWRWLVENNRDTVESDIDRAAFTESTATIEKMKAEER